MYTQILVFVKKYYLDFFCRYNNFVINIILL